MDQNRIVRSVPCDDAAGRERRLQVIGVPGRFTFVAPPGEVAHVHPRHYELLRQILLEVLPIAWKEAP